MFQTFFQNFSFYTGKDFLREWRYASIKYRAFGSFPFTKKNLFGFRDRARYSKNDTWSPDNFRMNQGDSMCSGARLVENGRIPVDEFMAVLDDALRSHFEQGEFRSGVCALRKKLCKKISRAWSCRRGSARSCPKFSDRPPKKVRLFSGRFESRPKFQRRGLALRACDADNKSFRLGWPKITLPAQAQSQWYME